MDQGLKQILFDLIKIDSSEKEGALADYVINFLKNTGFSLEIQDVAANRRNVIAARGEPTLVLAGHLDTVSFTTSEWTKLGLSPLEPKESDGKIYGRGSVDMKAGLAIMLKLAKDKAKDGLMLLFDVGEETDFLGIDKFVEEYKTKNNFQPRLFVFLEPTDLSICNKHKGLYECRYTIRGKTAHSSLPEIGNNPAKLMFDLFELEKKLAEEKFQDPDSEILPTINFGNGQFGLEAASIEEQLRPLDPDVKKEILASRITLYNRTKLNSVPNVFEFCFDIRTTPPFEANGGIEFVENYIRVAAEKRNLEVVGRQIVNNMPSLNVNKESLANLEKSIGSITGQTCQYSYKTGYTEAGIVAARLGIPAINFGPAPSAMAHCTGEYVEVESFDKVYKIMDRFLDSQL